MTYTLDITKCSACGKDHKNIRFRKLVLPIVDGPKMFTHVGKCPTNGTLIMMRPNENKLTYNKLPEP